MSTAISSNYARYGPLGIVFMLLTWLIALSVVMLGGAVVGAALHEHRRMRLAAGEPPQASGTDAAPGLPAPRPPDAEPLVDHADGA